MSDPFTGTAEADKNHAICFRIAYSLRRRGIVRIAQSVLRDEFEFIEPAEDDGGEDIIRPASIAEKCEAVCAELAATHGLPDVQFKAVENRVRFER